MLEPINHVHINTGDDAAIQDVRDQHLKMQTLYGQVLEDVNNLLNISLAFSAHFMPELRQKFGYPAVIIVMALVTAFIYRWFKRKKWL